MRKPIVKVRNFGRAAVCAEYGLALCCHTFLQDLEQSLFCRSVSNASDYLNVVDQQKLRIFVSTAQFRKRVRTFCTGNAHVLSEHEIFQELFCRAEDNARSRTVHDRIAANRLQQMRFADARASEKEERIHRTFHRIFGDRAAHGKSNAVRVAFHKGVEGIVRIEQSESLSVFRKESLFFTADQRFTDNRLFHSGFACGVRGHDHHLGRLAACRNRNQIIVDFRVCLLKRF